MKKIDKCEKCSNKKLCLNPDFYEVPLRCLEGGEFRPNRAEKRPIYVHLTRETFRAVKSGEIAAVNLRLDWIPRSIKRAAKLGADEVVFFDGNTDTKLFCRIERLALLRPFATDGGFLFIAFAISKVG